MKTYKKRLLTLIISFYVYAGAQAQPEEQSSERTDPICERTMTGSPRVKIDWEKIPKNTFVEKVAYDPDFQKLPFDFTFENMSHLTESEIIRILEFPIVENNIELVDWMLTTHMISHVLIKRQTHLNQTYLNR